MLTREEELAWDILSTADDIDFIEYRKTRKNTWLTRERKILHVSDMDTDHIVSCINMLERAGQQDTLSYEGLTEEVNRRLVEFMKEQNETTSI